MLRPAVTLPTSRVVGLLALGFAVAFVLVEGLARLAGVVPTPALHASLGVVAFELGVLLALVLVPRPSLRTGAPPATSVVVAAWNEVGTIRRTVEGLLAQTGLELEIVVVDDGSTDGTSEAVPVDARVVVVRAPHGGKGAALELGWRRARHPIVVTVDADTLLEPGALARLVSAFADERVVAAGGAVLVRGANDLLTRAQLVEYQKTTWIRAGWAALGVLEQIPGAFSAFRRSALEAAGGFPVDSLTEDYEITFRIRRALAGRPCAVVLVPEARAWTDPPRSLAAFARQRTRWFAGFLSTLFRFRGLFFDVRTGAFGLVRLPVKLVDAVLPLGLLASLSLFVVEASSGAALVSALGLSLLGLRVCVELGLYAVSDHLHLRAGGRREGEPDRASAWLTALLDPLAYTWLRALVVLRAYPFAALRIRTWERSRPEAEMLDAPAE